MLLCRALIYFVWAFSSVSFFLLFNKSKCVKVEQWKLNICANWIDVPFSFSPFCVPLSINSSLSFSVPTFLQHFMILDISFLFIYIYQKTRAIATHTSTETDIIIQLTQKYCLYFSLWFMIITIVIQQLFVDYIFLIEPLRNCVQINTNIFLK